MKKKKYVGVNYDNAKFMFKVTLLYKGTMLNLGWVDDEKEGAIRRDIKIMDLGLAQSKLQVLKPK